MGPRKDLLIAITTLAVMGCGIMGGIFFAFSNFVMRALAVQSPGEGIRAMQAINLQIINPLFLTVFAGTPLLLALLALTGVRHLSLPGSKLLLAGAVSYIVGALVITVLLNIPLNNRLALLESNSVEASHFWIKYLSAWVKWNHVRTVSALASTASLTLAIGQLRLRGV
jgi:uncharacterized membrane protein